MRYIQEQALDKANMVLKLKNFGIEILNDNNIDNKIIGKYSEHKFNNKFIIPITFDRKRYYRQIDSNNIITNDDLLESDKNEKKMEGILIDDQKNQFKKLKELDKKGYEYKEYLEKLFKIIQPYTLFKEDENIETGIDFNCVNDTHVLRYFNMDNVDWENRICLSNYSYTLNEKSEEKGIFESETKELIKGEKINLIGFIKLPYKIHNIYQKKNIGKFVKNNNIKKIEVGETTKIYIDEHGLSEGDIVLLINTNSNPIIDGKYIVDNVPDENSIVINYDTNGGKNGNRGELYNIYKLSYRINNIKKSGNDFVVDKEKKIINESKSNSVADVFIIKNKLDKDDYLKVLKLIIPSYETIIKNNLDLTSNSLDYENINTILGNYGININDLNIKEFRLIKKILENDSVEVKDNNKKENNKKIFNEFMNLDANDLYEDKYIDSEIIKKYYGKYPLYKKKYDNYTQRSLFIDKSNDGGDLYYTYLLSNKIKKVINSYNIKKLKENLNKLEKDIQQKKNKLENEKKLANYVNKDKCDIYSDKNNLIDSNKDIKYDQVQHLCNFENIDIDKIDIQKLQCYYFSNTCKNKKIYRLESRLFLLESIRDKISSLIKYMDNNYLEKYFSEKIEKAKNKLARFLIEYKKKDDTPEPIIEKKSDCKLTEIINKILQINNYELKKYLIFKIIDMDGILIDNHIYSKTFKCKMICGHWAYLKRIDNLHDTEEIDKVYAMMYGIYSDGGKDVTNFVTCKYCSNSLGLEGYDEVDGFDADGKLKNVRQAWDLEEYDVQFMTDDTKFNFYKNIDTDSFKEHLNKKGVEYKNMTTAKNIAELIRNITLKIGVLLKYTDYINIILDSINSFVELPSYDKFKYKELIKLKNKGLPKEKIIDMDKKEFFKKRYKKIIRIKEVSIIASQILLYIQSAIPDYKKKKTDSRCPFSGFDGEDGINFITCIILQMNILEDIFDKYDKDKNEQVKNTVSFLYKNFSNKPNIRQAIYLKKEYIKNKKKITEDIKREKLPVQKNIHLSNNFVDELKKSQDDKKIENLLNNYYSYSNNITNKIVNIVNEYIAKSIKLESTIESSCCIYDPNEDYYVELNKKYSELSKLIKESNKIEEYQKYIKIDGSFTRFNIPKTIKYDIIRDYTYINNENVTEDLINENFLNFCSTGHTAGEFHYFMGDGNNEKCIRCGMTKKEIIDNKYDENDLNKLLEKIAEKNLVYSKKSDHKEFNTSNFSKNNTDTKIDLFLKNIKENLTDTEIFTKKYFNDLGLYEKKYNLDKAKNDKDTIVLKQKLYSNRVDVLKDIINQYFRKYISLIKNNMVRGEYKINLEDDNPKVVDEIKKYIMNDNIQFIEFTEKNRDLFSLLKIKESISDINNINYEDDIYNCDYTKVIKQSKFNAVDSAKVLKNILFDNLNSFFDVVNKEIKTDKEDYKRTLTLFIIEVFKKINSTENIVNVSNETIEDIEGSISREKSKEEVQESKEEKEFIKVTGGEIDDDSPEEIDKRMNKKDIEDKAIEIAKKEIYERDGELASISQIENYKNDLLEDQRVSAEIDQDSGLMDSGDVEENFELLQEDLQNE